MNADHERVSDFSVLEDDELPIADELELIEDMYFGNGVPV